MSRTISQMGTVIMAWAVLVLGDVPVKKKVSLRSGSSVRYLQSISVMARSGS